MNITVSNIMGSVEDSEVICIRCYTRNHDFSSNYPQNALMFKFILVTHVQFLDCLIWQISLQTT